MPQSYQWWDRQMLRARRIDYRVLALARLFFALAAMLDSPPCHATILAKAVLMAGSWRLATISRESTRRSAPRFPSALPGEEWMDGS
jgi:hypothetical protein